MALDLIERTDGATARVGGVCFAVSVSNRRQRHHVVPRLHLRGFADADGRIVQLDLDSGLRQEVSVTDAAVIRNFYTLVLPDGSVTDAWERWLGDVEGAIAPALRRAIAMPTFQLDDGDRERLARWVALQFLRGPDSRRQMTELAALTLRAQVGMGGLAYLQYVMSQAMGREVTKAEAERVWDDVHSSAGPNVVADSEEHLSALARNYDAATASIYGRSWCRVTYTRKRLMVSDAPVSLVAGDGYDERGLAGSAAIAVPLDRRTLLWLERPGEEGARVDRDLHPSAVFANFYNLAAVASAERFVYFHPSDDPVPPDASLPRPRPRRLEVRGGLDFANRERPLADVLEQIAAHGSGSHGSLIADYSWPIPGYRPPSGCGGAGDAREGRAV
ncbi:DUF4238 domain-containing protein [Cellulomonas sp. PSBB021]|uniref:DUF4238 domain-containing protein n=1 Tax=Cellulomonas sp. PSBB021 TaxID=2003551 RepID=UPI000B8D63E6|nr:DUF4238 domain-containing protein [Cellulomonas sp. PSBB021]ASR56461.1 hypothetical protein CBP52_16675 [Cellulomonas sp. PSBB021]